MSVLELTERDAYTYLGMTSDNEYGIQMSMYASANILKSNLETAQTNKSKKLVFRPAKNNDEEDWEL